MRISDCQQLRREYLRKKTVDWSIRLFMVFLLLGVSAVGGFLLIQESLGTLLLFLVGSGYVGSKLWGLSGEAEAESNAMSYVPPVTPETLPAEEVLVRGSQEPTEVLSRMLLKAAGENAHVPKEQLLRAATEDL
jgi:hypothetical protein